MKLTSNTIASEAIQKHGELTIVTSRKQALNDAITDKADEGEFVLVLCACHQAYSMRVALDEMKGGVGAAKIYAFKSSLESPSGILSLVEDRYSYSDADGNIEMRVSRHWFVARLRSALEGQDSTCVIGVVVDGAAGDIAAAGGLNEATVRSYFGTLKRTINEAFTGVPIRVVDDCFYHGEGPRLADFWPSD